MEQYKDITLPARERAKDLLSRMTLEEKINQLSGVMIQGEANEEMLKNGVGPMALFGVKDTQKEFGEYVNSIQKIIVENSRWGIPALIHAEALSGSLVPNAPVYPASIGMGATFSPHLVEEMTDHIRKEMVNVGIRQALSPVLDLARDFRWGRTNETYGSDPTAVAAFGSAFVRGLQGEELRNGVAATCKHFLGYSQTEGGLNTAKTVVDAQDLRENFAKPFEAVIRDAGLCSVMNSTLNLTGNLFPVPSGY